MIAQLFAIVLFVFLLLSSSLDFFFSSDELEKMGIHPGSRESVCGRE